MSNSIFLPPTSTAGEYIWYKGTCYKNNGVSDQVPTVTTGYQGPFTDCSCKTLISSGSSQSSSSQSGSSSLTSSSQSALPSSSSGYSQIYYRAIDCETGNYVFNLWFDPRVATAETVYRQSVDPKISCAYYTADGENHSFAGVPPPLAFIGYGAYDSCPDCMSSSSSSSGGSGSSDSSSSSPSQSSDSSNRSSASGGSQGSGGSGGSQGSGGSGGSVPSGGSGVSSESSASSGSSSSSSSSVDTCCLFSECDFSGNWKYSYYGSIQNGGDAIIYCDGETCYSLCTSGPLSGEGSVFSPLSALYFTCDYIQWTVYDFWERA